MLSLVDKNAFNGNRISEQIRLIKKIVPPPQIKEKEVFDKSGSKKNVTTKTTKKRKKRKIKKKMKKD